MEQQTVDMSFREMLTGLFDLSFLTMAELKTMCDAGEMYAAAKVKNATRTAQQDKQLEKENERLREALKDLYNAVPDQTQDNDWWPDDLQRAMNKTKEILIK